MQTQKATHLCVAGLAFADFATPASSATFAAFLIAHANDTITFATPSSSCSTAALLPTPCSPLTLTSILSLPSRSPLALALPSILRCSSRLAEMARQAGGRRVYSLKPIIHS